ncbi:MAG TPA: glycosyltransferase family 4 protein [Deltaproteobacteria bacterium]|nr:glycosyltransferase family 4 protein [Deltaproteobacteria bacterium]HQI01837.1 glycosyltransferase family 4 protein [Deltaproteobacteria bacterium]
MKVCIAIEKFDPSIGGAERYCWDLAHFLVGKGHTVAVICLKASGSAVPAIKIIKVPALRFPQALRHLSFALLHFLKARSMRDFIHFCVGNTFFMDVYQPHGGVHRAWFLKETAMYRSPLRTFIRILRRLSLKDAVQRAMEYWIFTITRPEVIAISRMVEKDINTFFSYPHSKMHLVPNGVDLDKYNPKNRIHRSEIRHRYGMGDDEFAFLFVAQNPRLKGYDVLINACLGLEQLKFKVLIIGPCDGEMKKTAESLGDKVIFAGRAHDLCKIYPACDCLVHPTYYDACSLVVLEALASGISVITTHSNGAGMFVDGENGSVIDSGDVNALRRSMKEAVESQKKAVSISGLKNQAQVFAAVEEIMIGMEEHKAGPDQVITGP